MKVYQPISAIYVKLNAEVSQINNKVKLGHLETCIKSDRITNTLSIPKLEKAGYHITH